jgi:hypothetical protein
MTSLSAVPDYGTDPSGFRAIQARAWANKRAKGFNVTDVPLEFCLLSGEVAEAFDAWRKDRAHLGGELADVAVHLLGLAEMTGHDLGLEVARKLAVIEARAYAPLPNGVLVKQAAALPACPQGCGCRLGTEDADARECGCDGPCRGFPPVVCLCGSTRFVEEFNRQRKALTERGEIVLSIEVVTTQAREHDPQHCDPALKARLDELHKRKIDLADYVLVLNVGGYIGESTRSEIAYATACGKPVRYLEAPGRAA